MAWVGRRDPVLAICLGILCLVSACNRSDRERPRPGEQARARSLEAELSHHEVLRNPYTRVFAVELGAGKPMQWHRHDHDYVSVVLGPAEIETQVPGQPPERSRRSEGEVHFVRGGFAHQMRNVGNTGFRSLVVEILNGGRGHKLPEGEHTLDLGHGHSEQVLVDNPEVRVTEVEIAPGAESDQPTGELPALFVPLSDAHLERVGQGGRVEQMDLHAGSPAWTPAGKPYALRNAGRQIARLLAVEFK